MDHSNCPVKLTASIIGGKWKPSLLFHLEGRTRRFCELQRLIPGLTKKMLTQHLRELERDGIVHRKVYAEVPPRVEYSLTRHGESLKPILKLMSAWGTRHRARYGLTTARPQKPEMPCNPVDTTVPGAPLNSHLPRHVVAGEEIRDSKASA
ncbi:MAG TPA: helix-turn-helix domain-containing protein [Terriglobales bacterium]|nr:helix-turn-helix domain-containing protein [Terriglobales bacterium]